jgi:inhibitor of KinA sporulation pathway (predicted exonuclease)
VNWKDLEMFRSTNRNVLDNAEKLSRHLGWNRPKLVDLSAEHPNDTQFLRSFNINSAPEVAGEGFSGSLLVTKKGYENQISCIAVYSSGADAKKIKEFISYVRTKILFPM